MAEGIAVELGPQNGIIVTIAHISAQHNPLGVDLRQERDVICVCSNEISRLTQLKICADPAVQCAKRFCCEILSNERENMLSHLWTYFQHDS